MKNFLVSSGCILFILITAFIAAGQSVELAAFSKTDVGARIDAYFTAFNAGDEPLKEFFAANIHPESLKQRPVEPRVNFHRNVRNDFQKVKIEKIISATTSEVRLLGRAANGATINYSFQIDPESKLIKALGIEPAEGEDPALAAISAPATSAEFLKTAGSLFDDLSKNDSFSGVVLVTKGDKTIFAKAYGYASVEDKIANRMDTRFNIGSINKDFTRIAIGQLMKQGKLTWNDKLISVLPDYPNKEAAQKITIGQLVTMTSGIGDFVNDQFWSMDRKKLRSLQDYLALFGSRPLLFEPGTSRRYSNGGYVVLGLVIEKLSGTSYYDYVKKNIYKPGGMNNSDSDFTDALAPNTAFGYTRHHRSEPGRGRNTNVLSGRPSSAGGGYSTAGDLLKFVAALRNKTLEIPGDDGKFPDRFLGLGSSGGMEGANSLVEVDERSGYTVIVLSNIDPPSAERPGMQLMRWLKNIRES
jgi:CubicO group peptidase (beta-lactamase class C family)